ncbi:MAG TPA: DUF1858 domain-containing protein [Lachnospiraceae bacterium]|nr:DUF1858 domain-containing protein [Lachnospiraceae bacterium]
MQDKVIDLDRSVYELCSTNPEIVEILVQAGFQDIIKPGMLNTAGRFMTIPKGATMKRIDMESIKLLFTERGYVIK